MSLTKRNYVFVDYENTQAVDTGKLNGLPIRIVIFVGKNQKMLPVDLVKRLLEFQGVAEIYESAGSGKNALDFQLAFFAGRIFEREPEAFLHIVSKDKGFDPLVAHIKSQNRFCTRVDSFSALPFLRSVEPKTPSEKEDFSGYPLERRIEFALIKLKKIQPNSRPRKLKTLRSSLSSHFQKQLDEKAIQSLVSKLIEQGYVNVGESENVTYDIPFEGAA